MSTTPALQHLFISSKSFAVLGASADRSKYGNKVLLWYQSHGLDVVPIHPKVDEIEGLKTIRSLDMLSSPTTTSLSIVTPPHVSLNALKQVKALGIPAVWIQPGASDDVVNQYIVDNGLKAIYGGPCILVQGNKLLSSRL